jgi:hypothetical protein
VEEELQLQFVAKLHYLSVFLDKQANQEVFTSALDSAKRRPSVACDSLAQHDWF